MEAEAEARPAAKNVWVYGAFVALLLVVNGYLVADAAEDRSWGALGIAIMIGPIANGVVAVLSLLLIATMDLHGC